MDGVLQKDLIGTNQEAFPMFRCPACLKTGVIDGDQFHGRVSIECPHETNERGCAYHETKDWSSV
mgnify:CR=1 FL=1